MEYKKGSIVLKSGTVFDNGDIDPRPCHPTLIPLASDNITDDVYYLVITSNISKYLLYESKFYLIDEEMIEEAHLIVPSMINLAEIHKDRNFISTVGGLPPRLFKSVISKFKAYQDEHPHKYYNEIKAYI